MKKMMLPGLALLLAATLLTACHRADDRTLTIAEQYGIAYAPLQIMKEERLLETALPGMTVEWVQLGGPTAIRDGMLAGDIDVGFMGVGPMLIGVDTGMPWKCFTALSQNEVAFVTNRADIQTLADIGPSDRVAVLSPGSTQHILLCMAAKQALGDAEAFDTRLVSLSHPDAMSAMLAGGEIALHITTPPYIDLEVQAGMRRILTGVDVMGGPFTFICGVAATRLHDSQPEVYRALNDCLAAAIAQINADLPAAAHRLAPAYGVDEAMLLSQMRYQGSIYGTALQGVDGFARAMAELGLLSRGYTAAEYAFDGVTVLP